MSSLSASLCLFSAALCNVAVLDQKLFEQGNQQPSNQQQGIGSGGLLSSATGLLNNFAGGFGGQNNNNNRPGQGQKPRAHVSPCPKKFQYVTDGREWKGIIKLKNIDANRDIILEADFVLPAAQRRVSHRKCSKLASFKI